MEVFSLWDKYLLGFQGATVLIAIGEYSNQMITKVGTVSQIHDLPPISSALGRRCICWAGLVVLEIMD